MYSPYQFPNSYSPYAFSIPSYTGMNQQGQNVNSIPKVTGFEGAKAFPMGANQSIALFDANDNVFWLKTTDSAGFASYKTFRYNEEVENSVQVADGVTRKEFDELKAMVNELLSDDGK